MIYGSKYIKVQNLHGTGEDDPSDGSGVWKKYWENKTGRKFGVCSCRGCTEKATDGSHVQEEDADDKKWYIVPLCHACNTGREDPFDVLKNDLVPVNKK